MAEFLTTNATAFRIEELIRTAESRLILVTPYLKLSRTLLERLTDADRRGLQIVVVYGKTELASAELRKLEKLTHVSLSFLQHLHAKCYLNERMAVIGSMNLHEFSEKNNREMGILLSCDSDPQAFADVMEEVESVLAAAQPRLVRRAVLSRGTKHLPQPAIEHIQTGACIRCKVAMGYDPSRPLCDDCFRTWALWGNDDFPEKHCHRCGIAANTTRRRPLCAPCNRLQSRGTLGYSRVL